MEPNVELVYFGSCPNVGLARQALEDPFRSLGLAPGWQEWDAENPATAARVRGSGSTPVLIGGLDVRGGREGSAGWPCRPLQVALAPVSGRALHPRSHATRAPPNGGRISSAEGAPYTRHANTSDPALPPRTSRPPSSTVGEP